MCETESLAGRIGWITSLRGIAAITVVLCHWSNIFCPQLFLEKLAENTFEIVWHHSSLNALNNGSYGVQFFFVVSGFLITRSIYSAIDRDTEFSGLKYIIKKFTALLCIVIPGLLFPFILMRLGLLCNVTAAVLLKNDFIITYNDFYPSIFSLLKDLIRTFLNGSIYNGPLWTIPYELLRTVIISTIAFYVASSNTKGVISKILYLLFFLSTFHSVPNLGAFIIGAFVYDTLKNYNIDNSLIGHIIRLLHKKKYIKGLLFAAFFYMATINWHPVSGIWGWIPNSDPLIELIRSVGIAGMILEIS